MKYDTSVLALLLTLLISQSTFSMNHPAAPAAAAPSWRNEHFANFQPFMQQLATINHPLSDDRLWNGGRAELIAAITGLNNGDRQTLLDAAGSVGFYEGIKIVLRVGFREDSSPESEPRIWQLLFNRLLRNAACNGHFKIAKILVQHGADIYGLIGNDPVAFHKASFLDYDSDHDHFFSVPATTALHEAARNGHAEIVELFLQANSRFLQANSHSIDMQDSSYNTPLHEAALNGHIEVVKVLLKYGANTDKLNPLGVPLNLAAQQGHTEVVALLLPRYYAYETRMALHLAQTNGHVAVVQLLQNYKGRCSIQ